MPRDFEVIKRFKPEPPTEREQKAMEGISISDYSIYNRKMETICEEGKEIFTRMGVSSAIQAGDNIVAVYTAGGDMAVAVAGTYLHATTGQIPIKYILKHFKDDPTVGIKDGDFFFCNEAIYGGIHNPDQLGISPIFHQGELIAWVAVAGHEPETGACEPGGMPPSAKSRYDEGLKVPPMKLGENFRMRTDVIDMFVNMVRDERMQNNDTRARAAVCFKVRERVIELADKMGTDFVIGLLSKMVEVSAEGARKKISDLVDGTYRSVAFSDTVGYERGLLRLYVTVHKKGNSLKVDLTGSSPSTDTLFNTFPHIVRAHMASMLCQYIFCDLPVGSGIFEPIEVSAPAGTCVNAPLDAAISGSVGISPLVVNAFHQCVNKMMFASEERQYLAVPLGAAAKTCAYGGMNQHNMIMIGLLSLINATGGGARPGMDGVDSCGFWWAGMADFMDTEHDELLLPFLFMFRKLTMDQGGFGRYRGGTGTGVTIVLHKSPGFYIIPMGLSWRFPADRGLFGGYAGGVAPAVKIAGADWRRMFKEAPGDIPSDFHELVVDRKLKGEYRLKDTQPGEPYFEGESYTVAALGGSAYGDVLERDPERVMADLNSGIISEHVARNVYHVVYDPATLEADPQATERARQEERKDRLKRGKPYGEFEQEWITRRPPLDALKHYGTWPDPSAQRCYKGDVV